MKIRFYFSTTSLEQNGLYIAHTQKGHAVYTKATTVIVAEAWLEGSYFYTTGEDISHPALAASVTHMSFNGFEDAMLTLGHYAETDWEATMNEFGKDGDKTNIILRMKGYNPERLKAVHHQLLTGELIPTFVVKDKHLTSSQVAAIVYGEGDREHWLHVVQGAQDIVLKTTKTIEDLQQQVAALNSQIETLTHA